MPLTNIMYYINPYQHVKGLSESWGKGLYKEKKTSIETRTKCLENSLFLGYIDFQDMKIINHGLQTFSDNFPKKLYSIDNVNYIYRAVSSS